MDIFWCLNDCFVFEHRRNDGVGNRAAGGEKLLSEERNITWDGEKCKNGLVRIYRCYKERGQVVGCLRCMQVSAATNY